MRSSSPLARLLLLPLLLFLLVPAFAAEPVWTGVERVVAVGDVHGDFAQFVRCLRAAKVIDANNDWIAGKTHLVQTGDVLHRAPDSRKCFDLLMKLEVQSRQAGGMVHPLLGNHELVDLLDLESPYDSPAEMQGFGGPEAFHAALAPDGFYGKWLRTHDTVVKINDVLFVHAGLAPDLAKLSLAQINDAVRACLARPDRDSIAIDPDGPLLTRFLATGDETEVAAALDRVLKRYDARHMVIGHTVAPSGVVTRAAGRLIRIDVGMTAVFRGPAACLVIDKGVFYEARFPDVLRKLDVPAPAAEPVPAAP